MTTFHKIDGFAMTGPAHEPLPLDLVEQYADYASNAACRADREKYTYALGKAGWFRAMPGDPRPNATEIPAMPQPDTFACATAPEAIDAQIAANEHHGRVAPVRVETIEIIEGAICCERFKRHRYGSDGQCNRGPCKAVNPRHKQTSNDNDQPAQHSPSAQAVGDAPDATEQAGVCPVAPAGASHLNADPSASLDSAGSSPSEGPDGSAPISAARDAVTRTSGPDVQPATAQPTGSATCDASALSVGRSSGQGTFPEDEYRRADCWRRCGTLVGESLPPPAPPPAAPPAGDVSPPPSCETSPAFPSEPVPAVEWVPVGGEIRAEAPEDMAVRAVLRRFLEDVRNAANTALRLLD